MSRNFKRFWLRVGLIAFETMAVLAVLLVVLLGAVVVTLRSGPVNIDFAKKTIESHLVFREGQAFVQFENAALSWPEFDEPFMLGLDGVRVIKRGHDGGQDLEFISMKHVDLGLSKDGLLEGRVYPVSLVMRSLNLDVIRNELGAFDIGFGDMDLPKGDAADPDVAQEQTDFFETAMQSIGMGDAGEGDSVLRYLRLFEIQDAHLQYVDDGKDIFADLYAKTLIFESDPEGVRAKAVLGLANPEMEQSAASAYLEAVLSRDSSETNVYARLENIDLDSLTPYLGEEQDAVAHILQQDAVMNLEVHGSLDGHLNPKNVDFSLLSQEGAVQIDFMGKDPLLYQDLSLTGHYSRDDKSLSLVDSKISVRDATFEIAADLKQQEDGGFIGSVEAYIESLAQDKLAPLWPAELHEEVAREWLIDKMSGGVFQDVRAKLNVSLLRDKEAQDWQFDADQIILSMAMQDMNLDYRSPLPALEKAWAQAVFDVDKENLVIDISQGTIGGMSVDEAHLDFNTILQKGKGVVDIKVGLKGALDQVFSYIENEPLAVKHRFDKSKLRGDVALNVALSMPTLKDLKMEQVDIKVEGQVEQAFLPSVVKDMNLEGGPFKVFVNSQKAQVQGSGKLAGRFIDVDWMQYLHSSGKDFVSQVKAKLNADDQLRERLGIDLSDFVSGIAGVDVVYTEYAGDKATADVKLDLASSALFVEPFDYMKPVNKAASGYLKALLSGGNLTEIRGLKVSTDGLLLDNGRLLFEGEDSRLYKGSLGLVHIGETQGKIDFEIAKDTQMKVWVDGDVLDLRPFLKSDGEESADTQREVETRRPLMLSIKADRMLTADDRFISKGQIYADIDHLGRFNQLELDASAGKGAIYMRYKPDDTGARTFRLEADDAGAALRAFDLYDNMVGGKLLIYAEPISGIYDRNLVGLAEITDFRVVKAPGLARLLGAMSVPGISQLLKNEGVVFTKLESNFDWLYRYNGSVLVLKNGRTSGNSLGLTFDGVYNQGENSIDMNGTIIPMSGVNNVLGSVPILGEILGGSSGVFAATYTIKGKGEEPEVKVNPLSVLAPGILRRILFE